MGAALPKGKTLLESDEVSEAIDFWSSTRVGGGVGSTSGVRASGGGVVVVVSPWNFPLRSHVVALPPRGAGNTVILKPASNTVLVAHLLCECFYRGVPREALQMLPGQGVWWASRL